MYGVFLLQTGLFNFLVKLLRKWKHKKLTDGSLNNMLLGTLMAVTSQNHFAILLLTGRLVVARIFSFERSIGIILGLFIGKTFIFEIITINLQTFTLLMSLTGAILCLLKKNLEHIGYGLIGLSLIFESMWGFKLTASYLANSLLLHDFFFVINQNYLYAILTGVLLTIIIQSSAATAGLTMSFLLANMIFLSTGIAIILGANIGCCVILLLNIGIEKEVRFIAYTYSLLVILSLVLVYPSLEILAELGEKLSTTPDLQLAHIIVIIHTSVSLLVLPFIKRFKFPDSDSA